MMTMKLIYILLLSSAFFLTTGCSEDKGEKQEESKEDSVEEEVKDVVMQFFTAIENYSFNTAKEMSTKASYSSVKFLDKVSEDFNSCHLIEVKSCEVDKDKATCICEFGYYGEESIEKEIQVEKYGNDWLMNFQLGKNFDNIYLYDYGYVLNVSHEGLIQLSIGPELKMEVKKLIDRLNTSYVKLGFSSSDNVASVDSLYDGGTTYGYSDHFADGCTIHTDYDYRDGVLSSCVVLILDRDQGIDINQYYEAVYNLIVDKLGEPYNMPEKFKDDPSQVWELRWFIKSYNEILVLTSIDDHIQLSIEEIL